ncbi:serine protease [Paenibacillus mesophilus]|uniref:S1C family serine protease n=1 Tax=Paenibacillus mesophilus TaxID=2582849 RepID=UPI00110E6725|nr:S1C family serine protease [Paenibacillus mesophilus]TMV48141.1 serine protease [Paenibacillus mesophilus]
MKRGTIPVKALLWLLIVSLGCAFGGASPVSAADMNEIPNVIQQVTSSVVAVIGKPGEDGGKPSNRFDLAHGTGVIVRSDGYIVTNAHVVKDMSNIVVVTSDGKSYPGKTTHFDEESDLALVKIEAAGLKPAVFASASDVKVGETVIAIGTPISFALRNSVTVGIVSGLERAVNSKYQLLQTDAAINPGNSGGALVNMKGKVVGINTMKFADYSIDSLGFAIPVDTVQYVLDHFFTYGKVMRPYLGVELEESWEAVVGLPTEEELRIAYVDPDSPAANAGIKQGDIVIQFDQSSVKTIVEFNELMKKYLPKQTVKVTLKSGGQTVTREVVLGEEANAGSDWVRTSDGTYIDSDRGKTRIGDSHFGWSLKYPAGLIKARQSEEGDTVMFADSKGEFALNVTVEEKQSEDLSPVGLLRKALAKSGDLVLEKQYVERNEGSYAKIVGKTSSGSYYENRAFLKGSSIYYVLLYVQSEENYKNSFKQNTYLDLLDSFRLTFDTKDDALKDISVYKDGDTSYTNEYGLTFELPSDWSESAYADEPTYTNKDNSVQVAFRVTSASSGDTLDAWTEREQKRFEDSYVEASRKVGGWHEFELGGGVPAKENRYSSALGEDWESRHTIYFIKDKYKYEIDVTFFEEDGGADLEEFLRKLKTSLSISKDDMNARLGFIQDENELLDPNRTITVRNAKYKYSVKIPETWESVSGYYGAEGEADVSYMFDGGSFEIEADDRGKLDAVVEDLEQSYKKSAENDNKFKYEATEETVFGQPARKFAIEYKTKKAPYKETVYVLAKGNIVYTVTMQLDDAAHTEANANRMEQAFGSIVLD